MNFENFLRTDFINMIPAEFISSMLVMLIIIILTFVVYFKQKKYTYLDKPKGIVNVAETIVEFADKQVEELMGKRFEGFGGYAIALAAYIFLGFLIGIMGIPNFITLGEESLMPGITYNADGSIADYGWWLKALPNPFTNLAMPLSIGFVSVVLIEGYNLKYQHAKYFLKFVEPIPVINLVSMWTPMLSLALRLFGNVFAGFCLSTLCYSALAEVAGGWGLIAAPVLMSLVHAYFDVFSGVIQTMVFCMITMMNIGQAAPEEEEMVDNIRSVKTADAY